MAPMMHRWLFTSLIPVLLFASSCGDGGDGDGAVGGLGGTIGGLGTTSTLYVANNGSSDVTGYTINTGTGALVAIPGSPFSMASAPSAMTVSSNGFFAYVASSRANQVTAFRISTEGALLLTPGTAGTPNPVSVGTTPGAVVLSSDTKYLYVANGGSDNVTALSIGAAGVLTPVQASGGQTNPIPAGGADPVALSISPNGKFLYVANSGSNDVTVFSIGATGLLTRISGSGSNPNPISTGGRGPKGLAVTPSGSFLYVANGNSNDVTAFQIDVNGLLTLVPAAGTRTNPISVGGTSPNALMVLRNGRFLYTANGGGTVTGFSIEGDGSLSLVPSAGATRNPAPAGTSPISLTSSANGLFLYVANRGGRVSTYTVTEDSGTLTPLNVLLGNPFPTGTTPSSIATPVRP